MVQVNDPSSGLSRNMLVFMAAGVVGCSAHIYYSNLPRAQSTESIERLQRQHLRSARERYQISCYHCHEKIEEDYVDASCGTYHLEHFICSICDEAIDFPKYLMRNGKPCCAKHSHTVCDLCGARLEGKYFVNWHGDAYCYKHKKGKLRESFAGRTEKFTKRKWKTKTQFCFSCRRPISEKTTGGGIAYSDGRTICMVCRETAIDTIEQAQEAFYGVIEFLESIGVDLSRDNFNFRLTDQRGMDELVQKSKLPEGHVTTALSRLSTRPVWQKREVTEIVVLHGLPHDVFCANVAHELGHCYMWLNMYPRVARHVEEGMCELFSYLWLEHWSIVTSSSSLSKFKLRELECSSLDDPYGRGFHEAYRSHFGRPLGDVLNFVKRFETFPPDISDPKDGDKAIHEHH